ncbi:Capsule polysaccharide export inner-membrane protein [Escherichia coli]|uniref:Capsule polysaccharide export inner-membrane protein n=1 Tax=Escherichia coli TaxID=562 RepID=A0A376VZL9_ECOLX|nr:Capsule polysaccharide export inner-membrane protein [Escherichia coli]
MAVLLIYLAIFSQPRYMSESKVAIKRSDDLNSGSLNFGLLLGASNPSSAEDALYLKEYINSPDMLAALDKQLNFREAFSHSGLDFLNHLSKDETAEGFLKYYKDRINVSYDDKTGLLNIQTQGFSPEFALKFNQTVLKESERFINEMSHRIARDQLAFAETEMEKARPASGRQQSGIALLSGQQQRSGSTGTGTGGEHVSEYADGPEDPDGSGPAELADVSA